MTCKVQGYKNKTTVAGTPWDLGGGYLVPIICFQRRVSLAFGYIRHKSGFNGLVETAFLIKQLYIFSM